MKKIQNRIGLIADHKENNKHSIDVLGSVSEGGENLLGTQPEPECVKIELKSNGKNKKQKTKNATKQRIEPFSLCVAWSAPRDLSNFYHV